MNPAGRPGSMNLPFHHTVGSNKQKTLPFQATTTWPISATHDQTMSNSTRTFLTQTFSDSPRLPFRHRIGPVSRSLNLIAQIQAVDSFPLYYFTTSHSQIKAGSCAE
jgi:hypothetical protein